MGEALNVVAIRTHPNSSAVELNASRAPAIMPVCWLRPEQAQRRSRSRRTFARSSLIVSFLS